MDISLTDVAFIHERLNSEKDSKSRRHGVTPTPAYLVPPKKNKTAKGNKKTAKDKKSKGKKKSKKELEEEKAGYLIHQRKTLMNSFLHCCQKLKVDPDEALINQLSIQESVVDSKEERDAAWILKAIVSDGNRLGPGNMRALCCAISGRWLSTTAASPMFASHYEMLLDLSINNAMIGATGARAVAALLSTSTCTLQTLRLCSANNIGSEGCKALGNALSFSGGNRTLIELFLDGDVSIGDAGATELCTRLELNSNLKVLSMASCRIGNKGATSIAEMLKSVRNGIQYLNLECNTLKGVGITSLCAYGLSSSLQVINLASTGIQEKDSLIAVEALGNAIRRCKNLQAVDFNLNILNQTSAETLTLLLAKARRDGSKIDEFIITTSIASNLYKDLALDPSLMSSWTSRMRATNAYRRTPTPSPFGSEIVNNRK